MNNLHTKPPWRQNYLNIVDSEGRPIAAIVLAPDPKDDLPWEEKMANCRLMAKAPEMYELVTELHGMLMGLTVYPGSHYNEWRERVEKVLFEIRND